MAIVAVNGLCYAQHTLTMKLNDVTNDTAVVMTFNKTLRGVERQDSILAQGGVFTYDYRGTQARPAMVYFKKDNALKRMTVYLVPGEEGLLTGTSEQPVWNGSAFYTELAAYEAMTEGIDAQMRALTTDFQQQVAAGKNRDSLQAVVVPAYEALQKQQQTETMKFIQTHPSSGVSALNVMGTEDVEAALAALAPELKTGKFADVVSAFQTIVDQEKAQKEAAKAVADGQVAPDFTLKDINGNDFALSSLRGKYVVLDFWGSWCGWCIKGFPQMKEYYQKYAGKFEILGVDCNDTEEKWKAAVEKHQLPWKHVYHPNGASVTKKYAIQGYPTKIVVDPEGRIAKTIVGEDPAFYTYLDGLFGENGK
ncbi:MAG: TlpA family protein disulfide reductase [Bacteroidales bacterium]|nr:TlpA family protein disulfide reductase [Bacteroidales bacterium]